jgi:hypothetical protein
VGEILIRLQTGERVTIGTGDAESLTDALWEVSTRTGAVVLVSKLRNAGSEGEVAVADDDEAAAMLAALDHVAAMTPALRDLQWLVGGDRS